MTTPATDTLPSSLEQALALAQTLEEMLELEFEHLKAQNLDAFEASQPVKNDLLLQLVQLAGIQTAESADALGPEWDGFKEHMAQCRDMHRRNEVLIGRKIDAIRGALQSLQVQDPASSVEIYDRLGKLNRVRRGRGYSDA
ncbi:flagellar export chaperone FlgN [Limnohabitans sp.]|jgi:flagellar biosynthesis/type III secretory pathway chaperone|uniref:flagellar export chaperone FlgN n=1 Tax=Limnohabitans sp. TaxID=1907725 RepID=UPI00286F0C1B|nr:flagellar export chaperone FlgN [Limnohabitans sp.]